MTKLPKTVDLFQREKGKMRKNVAMHKLSFYIRKRTRVLVLGCVLQLVGRKIKKMANLFFLGSALFRLYFLCDHDLVGAKQLEMQLGTSATWESSCHHGEIATCTL
jgi:hypothetical protein